MPGARSGVAVLAPHETALYSHDMLQALKTIAVRQRQLRLAELLDAAAQEADRLSTRFGRSRK